MTSCQKPGVPAFPSWRGCAAGSYAGAQRCTGLFFDGGNRDTAAFHNGFMDALPIDEQTGLSLLLRHRSRMHACGHDGHMAMLLVSGQWINGHLDQLSRNVLLVFQPAEETTGGAQDICQTGIF